MSTPTLDPHTMRRLAFIRLLHQQGIDQSHQPEPLAFTSVTTFHDCVEFFLILTSEYLGITVNDRDPFIKRYWEGLHPSKHPGGVDLSGKIGIKRLTDLRNTFKHSAGMAGPTAIEQGRVDTANFLEDNTPKVFGIAYADIDMADIVSQADTRKKIKEAAREEAAGDRVAAMALLAQAFEELFREHVGASVFTPTKFSFGPKLFRPMPSRDIKRILDHTDQQSRRGPVRGAEQLAEQIVEVTKIVSALQSGLRIITLGVEFHRHHRFTQLTPHLDWMMDGTVRTWCPPGYAPSQADYQYCQQFVISAALRMAEMEAHITPPPWLTDPST